jgi:hypothetical protein
MEVEISWKNFATAINTILTKNGIPEDRHLGPFFLSANELNGEDRKEALTGKLFMYLWDDVLRHGLTSAIFNPVVSTYGQLTRRYNNQEQVFNDEFYELVEGQLLTVTGNPSEQNKLGVLSAVAETETAYGSEE